MDQAAGWKVGREERVPDARFVRDLWRFDPQLRIRWTREQSRWLIERKVTNGRTVDPGLFQGKNARDRFVCARDGYVEVLSVAPWVPLDDRVLLHLVAGDVWRYGGTKRYLELLERAEAAEEAAIERKQEGDWRDAACEMYEDLAWRTGRRIGMALRDRPPRSTTTRQVMVAA